MISIDRIKVEAQLQRFVGEEVYIHSEATSYVFVRNFKIKVTHAYLAG